VFEAMLAGRSGSSSRKVAVIRVPGGGAVAVIVGDEISSDSERKSGAFGPSQKGKEHCI